MIGTNKRLDKRPGLHLASIVYEFIACRLSNHALFTDSYPIITKTTADPV
jgi:hypothetical protein